MRNQKETTVLHDVPGSIPRLLFIDNIRWLMIMLVLSMHAAVTYSNQGGWYYVENNQLSRPVLFNFILYQSFLQSFFMPLLFFISGYFVPFAYDKKGPTRFLRDRAIRLGLPTLFYVFILGPLTEYYISHSWHPDPVDRSFVKEYTYYLTRFRFPGGTGPLWFCEALLIFCLIYTFYRKYSHHVSVKKFISQPTNLTLLSFILLVGFATFFNRSYF
jgi:glucan biosynthesis protein C